jgi:hypothetical protein
LNSRGVSPINDSNILVLLYPGSAALPRVLKDPVARPPGEELVVFKEKTRFQGVDILYSDISQMGL